MVGLGVGFSISKSRCQEDMEKTRKNTSGSAAFNLFIYYGIENLEVMVMAGKNTVLAYKMTEVQGKRHLLLEDTQE